jgi:uncharacterized iron-regulated protein
MKPYFFTFIMVLASTVFCFAQQKQAYQLFDSKGKKISFEKVLKESRQSDAIFFGEQHNNPIAHWLQLALANHLIEEKADKLIIGAEMFESDNQLILDEYLAGFISEKSFEQEARLWNNYQTDYKPIVEAAKRAEVPFVATNIPRRYASLVYRSGLESLDQLDEVAKTYIAPLPIPYDPELPSYKKMIGMIEGHSNDNFPKSQAIKDATMAHFIAESWQKGSTFLHLNGSYHSDNFEGIVWYLGKYQPAISPITITTVEQAALDQLDEEHLGSATFIIAVDQTMTKTY